MNWIMIASNPSTLNGRTLRVIGRFFMEEHKTIVPLTLRDILDKQIARKLA